jgi:uncharacterized membrane protein
VAREQYEVEIGAPSEDVFAYMDDIKNIGWHMSGRSSMPMMGGRLKLQVIKEAKGIGAMYRWKGSVMGIPIDIKETVIKWMEGREKTWETIEHPKMIVMSDYTMHLLLTPTEKGTRVLFEITYSLPVSPWGWILGKLLARKYARWCLQRSCEDAKLALEHKVAPEAA